MCVRSGKTQLSKRLSMIAEAVKPGAVVCDIGCDHAYLACHLVQRGISPLVYASDYPNGPVARARAYVAAEGLRDRVLVFQGDGLKPVRACTDADTIVLAGMGGELICRILSDAADFAFRPGMRLLIQPQNFLEKTRSFLHEQGCVIEEEYLCQEKGQYYVLLCARYAPAERPAKLEPVCGTVLTGSHSSLAGAYLAYRMGRAEYALKGLLSANEPDEKRLKQTREELALLRAALQR